MKILHINSQFNWGGGEQQTCDMMQAISSDYCSNILLCTKESALEKYCIDNKIQHVTSMNLSKGSFSVAREILLHIDRIQPDLLHVHEKKFLFPLLILKYVYKNNIKVVFSQKTLSPKKILKNYFRYNNPSIKAIICVSYAVKKSLDRVLSENNKDKSIVIYDGKIPPNKDQQSTIDLRQKYNISDKKYIVGNISNHNRSKDLSCFIETVNYMVNVLKHKDIHFVQIGSATSQTPKLEELIKKYNIEDYVTLTGFVDKAYNLNSQFDCYLMTSKKEGLPHTIMEVFYLGIPVVTTNAGGIPEVVLHEKTGLISEVGDFESLARNIIRLRNNPDLRQTIIANGKISFDENFATKKMAKRLIELYNMIINN